MKASETYFEMKIIVSVQQLEKLIYLDAAVITWIINGSKRKVLSSTIENGLFHMKAVGL